MDALLNRALSGKPLDDILIIDFHVHLGLYPHMHVPASNDAMIPIMERVGVDKICVNGFCYADHRDGNNRTAAFVRKYPDKAIGFATLNPFQGDVEEELKRCIFDLGMKGIKLHIGYGHCSSRLSHGNPRNAGGKWEKVWGLAAEHRMPVLFHDSVNEEDIKNFPQTTFVVAHGLGALSVGGRCSLEESDKYRMASCKNLYVDTAATQNSPHVAMETIRIFGADHIVWGTDASLDDFAQRLGIILDLPIGENDKRKILGENAAKLLRL